MPLFHDVGRVLDSEMLENRRLLRRPGPWLAEFPRMVPEVAEERRGILGAITTIIEFVIYYICLGVVAVAPVTAIVAFAVAHTGLEVLALIATPIAILTLAAVPFARRWVVIERGHPRRNAAMLVIILAAFALTSFFGTFILAHIDPQALWAPQ